MSINWKKRPCKEELCEPEPVSIFAGIDRGVAPPLSTVDPPSLTHAYLPGVGTHLISIVDGITKVTKVALKPETRKPIPPEDCECGHVGHPGVKCSVLSCACGKHCDKKHYLVIPHCRRKSKKELRRAHKRKMKAAGRPKKVVSEPETKREPVRAKLLDAHTSPSTAYMDELDRETERLGLRRAYEYQLE